MKFKCQLTLLHHHAHQLSITFPALVPPVDYHLAAWGNTNHISISDKDSMTQKKLYWVKSLSPTTSTVKGFVWAAWILFRETLLLFLPTRWLHLLSLIPFIHHQCLHTHCNWRERATTGVVLTQLNCYDKLNITCMDASL